MMWSLFIVEANKGIEHLVEDETFDEVVREVESAFTTSSSFLLPQPDDYECNPLLSEHFGKQAFFECPQYPRSVVYLAAAGSLLYVAVSDDSTLRLLREWKK
jgi:hypothetical protein